jgi:hypothetical protein
MAGFSSAGKSAMLGALTGTPYVSLHSADPGDTGANELAGVTRQAGALAAYSGGSRALTVATAHSVAGGQTVAYVGLWSASSGGTFYGSFAVTNETFGGAGSYQVDPSTLSLT